MYGVYFASSCSVSGKIFESLNIDGPAKSDHVTANYTKCYFC